MSLFRGILTRFADLRRFIDIYQKVGLLDLAWRVACFFGALFDLDIVEGEVSEDSP